MHALSFEMSSGIRLRNVVAIGFGVSTQERFACWHMVAKRGTRIRPQLGPAKYGQHHHTRGTRMPKKGTPATDTPATIDAPPPPPPPHLTAEQYLHAFAIGIVPT